VKLTLLRRSPVLLAALAACLAAGCGAKPVEVAPVMGKLTLNGKPLGKHRVEFVPEEPTGDRFLRSIAETDDKGQFTLMCDNGQPGAVVGWHKVVIAPIRFRGRAEEYPFAADNPNQPRRSTAGDVPTAGKLALYSSPGSTPERREVKAGDNVIEIALTN